MKFSTHAYKFLLCLTHFHIQPWPAGSSPKRSEPADDVDDDDIEIEKNPLVS